MPEPGDIFVARLRKLSAERPLDSLGPLLDAVDDLGNAEDARGHFEEVFRFIETNRDADLGSPGPLVHLLESLGGYDAELRASLERSPTELTLWMVNRLLNGTSDLRVRRGWLDLLRAVSEDPDLDRGIRDEARSFLDFQACREEL